MNDNVEENEIARLKSELKELAQELEKRTVTAFIQGAAWWEYEKSKFTMWKSDKVRAYKEALNKKERGTLGVDVFVLYCWPDEPEDEER